MEAIGFTKIRMWYQHLNFNFKDADEYVTVICLTPLAKGLLKSMDGDDAKQAAFRQDLREEYEKRMGDAVLDP